MANRRSEGKFWRQSVAALLALQVLGVPLPV